MTRKTHLAYGIEKTEHKSQYATYAKDLVSDKQVPARIVKEVTTEFKDYDISVIENCIEGKPEISVINVYPGKSTKKKLLE